MAVSPSKSEDPKESEAPLSDDASQSYAGTPATNSTDVSSGKADPQHDTESNGPDAQSSELLRDATRKFPTMLHATKETGSVSTSTDSSDRIHDLSTEANKSSTTRHYKHIEAKSKVSKAPSTKKKASEKAQSVEATRDTSDSDLISEAEPQFSSSHSSEDLAAMVSLMKRSIKKFEARRDRGSKKAPASTTKVFSSSRTKSVSKTEKPGKSPDSDKVTEANPELQSLQIGGFRISTVIQTSDEKTARTQDPKESSDTETVGPPGERLEYVRVDYCYEDHRWITKLSGQPSDGSEFDQYAFKVRRTLDYEGEELSVNVDIHNGHLKKVLRHILRNIKSSNFAVDPPTVDPDDLYFFLEEIRDHRQQLKSKLKAKRTETRAKQLKETIDALKVLIEFIEKEYSETKRKALPMQEQGVMTFPLLWTLFKPNDIIYTSTYELDTVPRAFRVDLAFTKKSVIEGEVLMVEGRYRNYDGKKFGWAEITVKIDPFRGTRAITSLPCYPLKFRKDHGQLREQLLARGQKFSKLSGIAFRHLEGMSFYKKSGDVVRLHVNARVAIDPVSFRRINPNYPVGPITPEDPDLLPPEPDSDDSTDSDTDKSDGEEDEEEVGGTTMLEKKEKPPRYRKKVVRLRGKGPNKKPTTHVVKVLQPPVRSGASLLEPIGQDYQFNEVDCLVSSPVVLGFSFQHKKWLELDVGGLRDIVFADDAFESLVLPPEQKQIVRALVETHSNKESVNANDLIQGKGEGLVAVLHGPPGCGKTLTAEGIAELLHKPLYTVSTGELGIRGDHLEQNFSQIVEMAHSWGAILLLDEADVFLEQRQPQDVGRNALVSIFLRVLEYFKGIVFLTTNRVVTFDEAFRSRIHIGLRYGELDLRARKQIWTLFLDRARGVADGAAAGTLHSQTTRSVEGILPSVTPCSNGLGPAPHPKCLGEARANTETEKEKTAESAAGTGVDAKAEVAVEKAVTMQIFTEEDIGRLSSHPLNGREIKNAVRTALSLARSEGKPLDVTHLEKVLKAGNAFALDLGGVVQEMLKLYA